MYSFLLLIQNFLTIKKQANFNPIGASFSPNYSDRPHMYTTSIPLKLYTTQTVSIPPTQKYQKITNCSETLRLAKQFQNPYINQTVPNCFKILLNYTISNSLY